MRVLNTNIDGKQNIMYALTAIKGVGRRYANLCCKKADVNMNKRYASVLYFPVARTAGQNDGEREGEVADLASDRETKEDVIP